MIIMKFGGSSVGSAAAIQQVANVVADAKDQAPVVVVSALRGVTDALIQAAQDAQTRAAEPQTIVASLRERHVSVCTDLGIESEGLLKPLVELEECLHGVYFLRELTDRSMDFIVSHGEMLSARIVAAHLTATGLPSHAVTGWDVGILTDSNFGQANVQPATDERIQQRCQYKDSVPVVTGFLGGTETGERTTLGRGGSDYTAAILGRALSAQEIQIWTDVSGIYSADPRVVPTAFSLDELSFEEAAELAFFGAKVLHPKTIEPAVQAGIPVRVLNTFDPEHSGTKIVGGNRSTERAIVGLAAKENNAILALESTRMLDAEGYLARVFDVLHRHRISVDAIATSEVSVCMTVEPRYHTALTVAATELQTVADVDVRHGRSLICAVGQGIRENPGTAAQIFKAMGDAGINIEMISMGSSKINCTFVVADEDTLAAMRALHDAMIA